MAQRQTKTTRSKTTGKTGTRGSGDKALERLHDSIDAAESALKDLRSEMSRGSRELLKDFETTLRDARKNLRRVSRHVTKDLEEVQQAVSGKRKPAKRRTGTASGSSTRKRTSARKN